MVAIKLFKMAQFIYQMSQPLSKKGLGMKNRLWQMIELYLINLLEGNSITKSNFFQITKLLQLFGRIIPAFVDGKYDMIRL